MKDHDKPLESLEQLQEKIDDIKFRTGHEVPDAPPVNNLGVAMRVGSELFAGVLVGGVMGYFLDRWLDTSPWLFIIFFFVGAGAGLRNIARRALSQKDE